MKRILIVVILAFAALSITSCAGSQKHCAAYAKHEANNGTSFKDVQ